MAIKIKKQWMWECSCGANGYEDTRQDAENAAYWHKQNCNHGKDK